MNQLGSLPTNIKHHLNGSVMPNLAYTGTGALLSRLNTAMNGTLATCMRRHPRTPASHRALRTPEEWGYANFILGNKDLDGIDVQFKPVLVSEGGDFDPEAWMRVIKASGAKFAGPVGEHHDGYSMWHSEVDEWNTVNHGPNLDLTKLFADLVRENYMKLVVAMHQAYNSNGFF